MKRKLLGIIILLVALVLGTAVVSAAVQIDGFTGITQSTVVVCPVPLPTSTDTQLAGSAIGGERDIRVDCISGAGVGDVTVDDTTGTVSFSQGSGVSARGEVTWDGVDGTTLLNPAGLGGFDLTEAGQNSAIHIIVTNSDLGIPVRLRVYSGTTADYRERTVNIPGGITAGSTVSIILPFTSFSTVGGGDFTNVGAIELLFDGTNDADADLTIALLIATNETFDFGDLPNSYLTTLAAGGPRHQMISTLRLGQNVDVEIDGPATGNANNDDSTLSDDEDGITIPPGGANTFGDGSADLQYTVRGPAGANGCLVGWIDWDQDGTFDTDLSNGVSELIVNQFVSAGTVNQTLSFTSPNAAGYVYPLSPAGLFARFRLFPPNDPLFGGNVDANGCPTAGVGSTLLPLVGGAAADGEVEDYLIQFGSPTAVSLQSIDATAGSNNIVIALAGALLLTLIGAGFMLVRRQQV